MTHPRRSLCTPSAGTGGRTCPGGLHPLRHLRRLSRCPGRSEETPRGGDNHRNRSRPARRRRPPRPCGTGRGGERGRPSARFPPPPPRPTPRPAHAPPPRLCSRFPPAPPRCPPPPPLPPFPGPATRNGAWARYCGLRREETGAILRGEEAAPRRLPPPQARGLGGRDTHTERTQAAAPPPPPIHTALPGERPRVVGVSPGVLKLDEGERRAPAAVLEVDVADGPVLVEDVLDVLGADVGGQIPHVDAAVVVAGWAADHAPSGHGKVSNGCGGGGPERGERAGKRARGRDRADRGAHTPPPPTTAYKMATAAPLAVLLRAAISPRDAAPPALEANEAAPASPAAPSLLPPAHARPRRKVVPSFSPLGRDHPGSRTRDWRRSSRVRRCGELGSPSEKPLRRRRREERTRSPSCGFDGGGPFGVTSGAASAPRRPGRGREGCIPQCIAVAVEGRGEGSLAPRCGACPTMHCGGRAVCSSCGGGGRAGWDGGRAGRSVAAGTEGLRRGASPRSRFCHVVVCPGGSGEKGSARSPGGREGRG